MLQNKPLIRIVDDDDAMRRSLAFLLEGEGWDVVTFPDAYSFLSNARFDRPGCLLLDVRMPEMSGLELQRLLKERRLTMPIIFLSGHGDIDMAVHSIKEGAVDFLQKPVDDARLLATIASAVERDIQNCSQKVEIAGDRARYEQLTGREKQVIELVSQGLANKTVADRLGISEKTVQVHRGSAYRKLGMHSAAEIARMLLRIGISH